MDGGAEHYATGVYRGGAGEGLQMQIQGRPEIGALKSALAVTYKRTRSHSHSAHRAKNLGPF